MPTPYVKKKEGGKHAQHLVEFMNTPSDQVVRRFCSHVTPVLPEDQAVIGKLLLEAAIPGALAREKFKACIAHFEKQIRARRWILRDMRIQRGPFLQLTKGRNVSNEGLSSLDAPTSLEKMQRDPWYCLREYLCKKEGRKAYYRHHGNVIRCAFPQCYNPTEDGIDKQEELKAKGLLPADEFKEWLTTKWVERKCLERKKKSKEWETVRKHKLWYCATWFWQQRTNLCGCCPDHYSLAREHLRKPAEKSLRFERRRTVRPAHRQPGSKMKCSVCAETYFAEKYSVAGDTTLCPTCRIEETDAPLTE